MHWRLFATLAEAAGEDEVVIEDATTLREAFDALLAAHPDVESEVLDANDELYDHVRLLVDGSDPFAAGDGWETELDPDAELALFPPVSGG